MKSCNKCGLEKPLGEFNKRLDSPDGLRGECRACNHLKCKIWYWEHRDRSLEAHKIWRIKNHSKALENSKRWHEENRVRSSEIKEAWRKRNLIKVKIHKKVQNAVYAGKIKKPKRCSNCKMKKKRIEGHHADYSKPLEVIWLCCMCHKRSHSKLME